MARQYGFIIDTDRCVDCRACVTACQAGNRIEVGVAWRHVASMWKGSFPNVSFTSLSMACNHCAEPACVPVCPVQAISKREADGIVMVDRAKCIGCTLCGQACPYNAPQYGKDGIMQKCDLCVDRLDAGLQPACVTTCSAGALAFGTMEELPALAGKKNLVRLEGPTRPSVFIPAAGA